MMAIVRSHGHFNDKFNEKCLFWILTAGKGKQDECSRSRITEMAQVK